MAVLKNYRGIKMQQMNLKANNKNEELILEFLKNNASDELTEKINNGEKTLAQCWEFITKEAKTYLNGKSGGIEDSVVFGWAIHFFEEDDIKPTKAKPKAKEVEEEDDDENFEEEVKVESKPKKEKAPKVESNKGYEQTSLFDFL